MFIFQDRENTGNLAKNIKNMFLHGELVSNTGKGLNFKSLTQFTPNLPTTELMRFLLIKPTVSFDVRNLAKNLCNTGKTQRKHREFHLGWNIATLF